MRSSKLEATVSIARALAHPARLRIVAMLRAECEARLGVALFAP